MCKTIENWIPTAQPPWNCKNTMSLIQARSFLRIYFGGNTLSNTMSDHLSDMNRRTTLKSLMDALNCEIQCGYGVLLFPFVSSVLFKQFDIKVFITSWSVKQ